MYNIQSLKYLKEIPERVLNLGYKRHICSLYSFYSLTIHWNHWYLLWSFCVILFYQQSIGISCCLDLSHRFDIWSSFYKIIYLCFPRTLSIYLLKDCVTFILIEGTVFTLLCHSRLFQFLDNFWFLNCILLLNHPDFFQKISKIFEKII